MIVEVLSPTTEGYDRGEKFEHYRTFPSLRHYVLVTTGRDHVDHFRRNEDGSWTLRALGPGDTVVLDAIDATLSVDAIYEGVQATRSPAPGSPG